MGRPEKPVDHTVPALGALAEHLRAIRREAGLTYRQLADCTNYSAAQLKRAASGVSLPSQELVSWYARGCAVHIKDQEAQAMAILETYYLHHKAHESVYKHRIEARASTVLPKPEYARDLADLSGAMRDAWSRAGRPSSREMEDLTDGLLPRSTAHAICKGRAVPQDFRRFVAFLHVCGVRGSALGPWFRAWFKVRGRPNGNNVAAALQFLQTDERQVFIDVYVEAAETPEQASRELGFIADIMHQLQEHERRSAARRDGSLDEQPDAMHSQVASEKESAQRDAFVAALRPIVANNASSPTRAPLRRRLDQAMRRTTTVKGPHGQVTQVALG